MKIANGRTGGGSQLIRPIWSVFLLIVVILMILLTLGISALRIGNFLPENTNVIFIVPKEPSFQTGEGEDVWSTQTKLDIFEAQYVNGEGETTVYSQDGDKIVAPGTVAAYDFCVYNDGNMAMAYEVGFSFALQVGGIAAETAFPLSLRLRRTDGEYLAGGGDDWERLPLNGEWEYTGILGVDSYERFALEVRWEFEGNDELDTAIGNGSAQAPVTLSFVIDTYAEANDDPTAEGGVAVDDGEWAASGGEYGGTIRWDLFAILILATLALTAYVVWVA